MAHPARLGVRTPSPLRPMKEYTVNYEDENEDAPGAWYGWDWANPGENELEMREALFDHFDHFDGEAGIEAVMAYLAEVDRVLDEDGHYTGEAIAELFKARIAVEYESWAKVAEPWIDDHYPGLLKDPLIRDAFGPMVTEWEDLLGRVIAGADSTRYWWHETGAGTILAVLRPGYTSEGVVQ